MDQRQLAKRTSNALERLEQVEKTIPQILGAVNQTVGQVQAQLSSAVEVLDAVVQSLGVENIEKLVSDNRREKATQRMEEEKKQLAALLDAKLILAEDKVTEKSIIVGVETDKDGTARHPGRMQHGFNMIAPQFRDKLLGQVAGFKLPLPNGGNFEVQEIYGPNPTPPAPAEAAPATEAPAAPAVDASTAPAADTTGSAQ